MNTLIIELIIEVLKLIFYLSLGMGFDKKISKIFVKYGHYTKYFNLTRLKYLFSALYIVSLTIISNINKFKFVFKNKKIVSKIFNVDLMDYLDAIFFIIYLYLSFNFNVIEYNFSNKLFLFMVIRTIYRIIKLSTKINQYNGHQKVLLDFIGDKINDVDKLEPFMDILKELKNIDKKEDITNDLINKINGLDLSEFNFDNKYLNMVKKIKDDKIIDKDIIFELIN